MQLMSFRSMARCLGDETRSQLYKLMNDECLDEHVQMPSGQWLLDVEGLREKLQCTCQ